VADDVVCLRRADHTNNAIHVWLLLTQWPGETNPLQERSDEEEELHLS